MVDKDTQERILADYDANAHTYAILAPKLEQLLREILPERGIQVHSITSRPKKRTSLAGKLTRNDANYEKLADLTDLVGLRVTTYFAEDVDHVAAVIAEEFDIDPNNSVDKRRSLAADRFGYLSLHHVLSLKDSRCELTEYKAFKGLKIELQTRSILQHAWAEIEHDLGYKSEIEVPQHIRRRFALVAGLLELADREFDGIKAELDAYRLEVSTTVQENPEEISLNLDSMRAFVTSSALVEQLDREIISIYNAKSRDNGEGMIPIILKDMEVLSMKSIGDVSSALQAHQDAILAFARISHEINKNPEISSYLCIHYLFLVIACSKDIQQATTLLQEADFTAPVPVSTTLVQIARRAMNIPDVIQ